MIELFLYRLKLVLLNVLDQLFMIVNLPTFDIEGRMRRLRRIYYSNPHVTVDYGQVRDILHGHVDRRYRHYYERVLSIERIVYLACQKLPSGARSSEVMYHTQLLGNRIVQLVNELQLTETLLQNPSTMDSKFLLEQQADLNRKTEDALTIHAHLPSRVAALCKVRETREMKRLTEGIQRLTTFLDDVEASYAEATLYIRSVDDD